MLKLILGRSGSGKTYYIRNLISQKLKSKEENVILIVPHESLFENEKAIFNLVGENLNNKVKIMSFKTLSDFVFERVGKSPGKIINNSERILLMHLAIDSIKEKLVLYKNFASKPEFINLTISTLVDFKNNNINLDQLSKMENSLPENTLKTKLKEIILILNAYNKLLGNTFLDPLDNLTRLSKALSENEIFNDYTIMIDGFFEFSAQELLVLEKLIGQNSNIFISICTDNENSELFSTSNKTVSSILNIAKKNNITIEKPLFLPTIYRFKKQGLKNLEANIFSSDKKCFNEIPDDVLIYNAKDIYEEASFIAKAIKKLVFENNYRYSDLSIISCEKENIHMLSTAIKEHGIPHFINEKAPNPSLIINLVLSAFDVVNTDFSSDCIFKYLKTGLTNLTIDETSNLENYIMLWSITGETWKKDFVSNPKGLCESIKDSDVEILKSLNILREKVMAPLLKFSNIIKNTDAKTITKAIYELLENLNVGLYLKNFVEDLQKNKYEDLANSLAKSWDLLMDTFDQIVNLLDNTPMTPQKYKDLLNLLSSQQIVSSAKKLDEVYIGTVDKINTENPKAIFLCGCTDKNFPNYSMPESIFTTEEIEKLNALNPGLFKSAKELIIKEQFRSYKAITSTQENLYISWATSQPMGETNLPSEIIEKICSTFPNIKILADYSYNMYDEIFSEEEALNTYIRHASEKSLFSETLKHYLSEKPSYTEKIKKLEKVALNKPIHFQDIQTAKNLFGKTLRLSASQIEKYYLCPFQFFCKYGLYAKPLKPAKFDALEYGKLMHFILEKILSQYKASKILSFSKDELENKIEKLLNIYAQTKFVSQQDETPRSKYLFSNVIKTACPLIFHIAKELSQSDFAATAFELSISENGKIKPLVLNLPDNSSVEVIGKIDRVDIMKRDFKNYIRIVDYKTGTKEFKLFDVLYGLNIQMILYLLAILKSSEESGSKNIPAGILYMPAQKPTVSADRDIPDNKIKDQKSKKLRMNGLILNSPEIIYGMEKEAKGEFIPVVMKDDVPKKSDSLVTTFQMDSILNYTENLVISMATALKDGEISPMPAKGEYDACTYCEYSSICGFMGENNSREIKTVEHDAFFEEILKDRRL
ncbi:MAG: ATP-dependent helicase/deoxyribonuclease subunit B [Eubacteriales bacterium SKADARSKE-1]|nr:ATP-dependent helicase/deoxyribonuclease subunit B [Eubacteriales bacterium SKADARSKE-1]